jgi:diguanylate cyclase (GGDEF)-like protein/PAS domain S-box-containing protein
MEGVQAYLSEGLTAGDSVVVVATQDHRRQLRAAMVASGISIAEAEASGLYVAVDAAETLVATMVGDLPDPGRFRERLGGPIAEAGHGGRAVRVYDDLVSLLLGAGKVHAALSLEDLWNDLGLGHAFGLYCAYPVAAFAGNSNAAAFRRVCSQHSQVMFSHPEGTLTKRLLGGVDRPRLPEGRRTDRETRKSDAPPGNAFRVLVESVSDLVITADAQGTVLYCSPAVEGTLGMSPEGIVRTPLLRLLHPDDRRRMQRVFDLTNERVAFGPQRLRGRHADRSWRWLDVTTTPLDPDFGMGAFAIVARDVTDPVTGLPDRTGIMVSLREALNTFGEMGRPFTLVMLDLDRFAVLNHGLGPDAGDLVLRVVGERISAASGAEAVVARSGGDEFCVILPGSPGTAETCAGAIARAITQPIDVAGQRLLVTASMGIVHADSDDTPYGVLADAEMSVREARSGQRPFVFDALLRTGSRTQFETEIKLRRALDDDQLVVFYQPIIDLATGEVGAAEALVRWQHPDLGLLAPSSFIPLAEATGLIVPIGTNVLAQALKASVTWPAGVNGRAPTVCVNLAARQLADPGLVDTVAELLEEIGVDPSQLILEVTESDAMREADTALAVLSQLRDLGVGLTLDDFGTGYSSLAYLERFPVEGLKIDRSFVSRLLPEGGDRTIVGAVVQLARSLGLATVAEGVESEAQLEVVGSLGCTMAQGYLFAKPMPEERFLEYLVGRQTFPLAAAAGWASRSWTIPTIPGAARRPGAAEKKVRAAPTST